MIAGYLLDIIMALVKKQSEQVTWLDSLSALIKLLTLKLSKKWRRTKLLEASI
jgi:hypothetical protein